MGFTRQTLEELLATPCFRSSASPREAEVQDKCHCQSHATKTGQPEAARALFLIHVTQPLAVLVYNVMMLVVGPAFPQFLR
jgi:hypothetical protein